MLLVLTFTRSIIAQWSKTIRLSFKFCFVRLQRYSEGKLYSSTSLFPTIAFHIEATPLADGTYELIQEPDGDIFEAQANVFELTEVPNSDSEEPKPTDSIDTTTGKPRCIILLFQIMQPTITIYLCI